MSDNNNTVPERKVKTYPNNFEAEQSVLCCLLIDGDAVRSLVGKMSEDCFYNKKNRLVYQAMCALFNNDEPIDIITVYDYMVKARTADEHTLDYLTTLNNLLPSGANYTQYSKLIYRDMVLRSVISSCNKIIEKAYDSKDADEVVRFAEKEIYDISRDMSHNELVHVSKATIEVMERIEKIKKDKNAFRGLPTDFKIYDRITGGLQNGDLIILAARPSIGKTAFALNIVANIVSRTDSADKCIAVFSLEMPARQLAQRMMCNLGVVPMNEIKTAQLKGDGDTRLWKVTQKLSNSKVYINDSSVVTPAEIISQCRRLGAEHNNGRVDLVVIDYLQLMSSGTASRGEANRQQEVANMSRMMKIMSRELNCPVILLSQLSRNVEMRKGEPQLSDLRESGAIE
ncbi:MAG: replicative DNA helicase, partial [Christensenellales bacterium]